LGPIEMTSKQEVQQVLDDLWIPTSLVLLIKSFIDLEGIVSSLPIRFRGFQSRGIVADSKGHLYVADKTKIVKMTSEGVVVKSFGGFEDVSHLTIDSRENMYCTDCGDDRIKKLSSDGKLSLIAGNGKEGFRNGTAFDASFNRPRGIVIDQHDNLYVAERDNNRIRKITPEGVVSTFAGSGQSGLSDGEGIAARFNSPCGLAIDGQGNIYVADHLNSRVRKITSKGVVSTLSVVNNPLGIAVDGDSIYVCGFKFLFSLPADRVIRRSPPSGVWDLTYGGHEEQRDGVGVEVGFKCPYGICVGEGCLYVYDNDRIRKIV